MSNSTNDTLNYTADQTLNSTNKAIEDLKFLDLVTQICSVVFVLEAVVGIIGNSLALTVLMRKGFRGSSSAVYLRALAVVDSLILVIFATSSIEQVKVVVCSLTIPCFAIEFIATTATDMSIWILMLLTAERLLAILRPYYTRIVFTVRRSQVALVVTLLVLAGLDSHDLWYAAKGKCQHCIVVYPEGDILNDVYSYLNSVMAWYLPFPVLSTSCIIIMIQVRFRRLKRAKILDNTCPIKDQVPKINDQSKTPLNDQSKSPVNDQSKTPVNDQWKTSIEVCSDSMKQDSNGKRQIPAPSPGPNGGNKTKTRNVPRKGGRNKGMYATLIALNICFIVTRLPHDIYKNLNVGEHNPRSFAIKQIIFLFVMINHMINIFLYVGLGSKFRAEFIGFFKDIKSTKFY